MEKMHISITRDVEKNEYSFEVSNGEGIKYITGQALDPIDIMYSMNNEFYEIGWWKFEQ
jgi:hypothetical protein